MMPPMIAPPTSLPQFASRPVGYGWPLMTTVPPSRPVHLREVRLRTTVGLVSPLAGSLGQSLRQDPWRVSWRAVERAVRLRQGGSGPPPHAVPASWR